MKSNTKYYYEPDYDNNIYCRSGSHKYYCQQPLQLFVTNSRKRYCEECLIHLEDTDVRFAMGLEACDNCLLRD